MSSTSLAGHQHLLSRTNLYIRGLKPETTDKDLVTLCQQLVLSTYLLCVYLKQPIVQGIEVIFTPHNTLMSLVY